MDFIFIVGDIFFLLHCSQRFQSIQDFFFHIKRKTIHTQRLFLCHAVHASHIYDQGEILFDFGNPGKTFVPVIF